VDYIGTEGRGSNDIGIRSRTSWWSAPYYGPNLWKYNSKSFSTLLSRTRAGDVSLNFGMGHVYQSVKVSVKVKDVEVTGCPNINTFSSSSRARLVAFFFNAGEITPLPEPPTLQAELTMYWSRSVSKGAQIPLINRNFLRFGLMSEDVQTQDASWDLGLLQSHWAK